ncbi:MAG TPA: YtxH domain-containing protein [Candidatus Saccharimonadales bacterium]|nr:YtxH domain-containing protein [Candidatus Saccharimonadales bacterium]
MSKNSTVKKFAIGTILAAAAGYLAGILTAPKSGKETRQDIKEAAVKTYSEAEKQLKKLHTELNEVLAEAKGRLETVKGKAHDELEKAMDAGKTMKEKARELLSAVHEGDADDKDLKKAIDEANKAVEHLKSYLKKD